LGKVIICKQCNEPMEIDKCLPGDVVVYRCDACKIAEMLNGKTGKKVETGHVIRRGA
jgi:hypothetical protein